MTETPLNEYRCQCCNKLFFKADVETARIEIKCKNCKKITLIDERKNICFLPVQNQGSFRPAN